MEAAFIDPRDETPALRRAAVLLARVREDAGGGDSSVAALQEGIGAMQRAAKAGLKVPSSAIAGMEVVLEQVVPPAPSSDGSVSDLVRCNALIETRELLARLAHGRHVTDSCDG